MTFSSHIKPPSDDHKPINSQQRLKCSDYVRFLHVVSKCKITSRHFVLLDVRQAVTQAQKNF